MIVIESLTEVMSYIYQNHKGIVDKNKGIIAYKILKKPDRTRILFEKIDGFRVVKHNVINENTLVIDTFASGTTTNNSNKSFKSDSVYNIKSSMILHDLSLIHLYDHSAEFYSFNFIDFVYMQKDQLSERVLLDEWIREDDGILRAKWSCGNADKINTLETEIDEMYLKKIQLSTNKPRYLDMDM